jgi:hypothetical protein
MEYEERDILHMKQLGSEELINKLYKIFFIIPATVLILVLYRIIFERAPLYDLWFPFILFFSISMVIYITDHFDMQEHVKRGPEIELQKGKFIFEFKYKPVIYELQIIGFILYFIYWITMLIWFGISFVGFIVLSLFVTCVAVVIVSLPKLSTRFIWVYSNGIGLENGTFESYYSISNIEKIIIKQKGKSNSITLKIDDKYEYTRKYIGIEIENLINVLKKEFPKKMIFKNKW